MVKATKEQGTFFDSVQRVQKTIIDAYNSGNTKLYEELVCKYTGPGTGMMFRNGFLIPAYNIYDHNGNLLMAEGDVVNNV